RLSLITIELDTQRQFTISPAKSLAAGGASRYHDAAMEVFLNQLINGLQRGSIYALIALGYTMVYGVLRLINFAHGEVFMIGAFVGYFAALLLGLNLPSALLAAMAVCGLLAVAMEAAVYRPLRCRPRLSMLIAAIGVSLLLSSLVQ